MGTSNLKNRKVNNFMEPFECSAKKSNLLDESQIKLGYNTARHSELEYIVTNDRYNVFESIDTELINNETPVTGTPVTNGFNSQDQSVTDTDF